MGSGILLAVLVVLWIVVLVPMVLHRGSATGAGTNEGTGSTMRVLHRRGSGSEKSAGLTGGAMARLKRPLRDPRVEADVVARRRRTLIGLITLAVAWALLAVFYRSYFWTAQIVLDLMVFAYLVYLRLEAQREAERRDRRAVRFADRPTPSRAPGRRPTVPETSTTSTTRPPTSTTRPPTFSDVDVTAPIPRATPTPVTGGWTPNPVPVPTYVNKATAPPQRHRLDEQLVSIDDDDPNFADVADWHGKRAVGD
jgi:Ca2+/Na+ antiporter